MAQTSPPICRFLFTYGTLMSFAGGRMGQAQRDRLAREQASPPVAATAKGRLFDLGRYPGFVETAGDAIVRGELRELADPVRTLAWLDDYEGIVRGHHDHNEYARVERQVTLADGQMITAWIYLYLKPSGGLREIPDGRWTAPSID